MSAESYRTLGLTVPISEILDAELWVQRYAHGLPVLDTNTLRPERAGDAREACAGASAALAEVVRPMPPATIRWHLRSALSELEMKLGLPMGIVVCKSEPLDEGEVLGQTFDQLVPPRPFSAQEAVEYYKIDLPSGIISVERVRGYFFDQKVWEISAARGNKSSLILEWPRQGATHMLPINMAQFVVPQAGGYLLTLYQIMASRHATLPGFWRLDYTRGPVSNHGQVGQIEIALANWCGMRAARTLLPLAATALSKGTGSQSVSYDGFSRSASLAGKNPFSAIEDAYTALDDAIDWDRIRSYKKGFRVRPFAR